MAVFELEISEIKNIVIYQFVFCILLSLFFIFVQFSWFLSGIAAGLVVCIPNCLFIFITRCDSMNDETSISSQFFIGWLFRFILSVVLLFIAIAIMKVAIKPFFLVFIMVMLVPAFLPTLSNRINRVFNNNR